MQSNIESFKQFKLVELREKRRAKHRSRIRRKVCAALMIASVAAASFGTFYTVSAKEITITEINEFEGVQNSVTVTTRKSDVEDLLNEQGITVTDTDKLNVAMDSAVADSGEIIIRHGKEIKIVTAQGDHTAVVTSTDTDTALREAGVITSDLDEVKLNGEDIASSDTVEIRPVETTEVTESITVEFETIYKDDPDMYEGEEKVETEGENGETVKVYSVSRYTDSGEEKERVFLREETVKEPVSKVVLLGTKEKPASTEAPEATSTASAGTAASTEETSVTATAAPAASASSSANTIAGHKFSKVVEMEGTAYTDSPAENGGYSTTAMGTALRKGVVAVDPSVIPLGSKVYVVTKDGSYVYGEAVAEDTGGAIKGNRIDLCIPSASEMSDFGRQQVLVYILED